MHGSPGTGRIGPDGPSGRWVSFLLPALVHNPNSELEVLTVAGLPRGYHHLHVL